MKKRAALVILAVMLCLASVLMLAACNSNMTVEFDLTFLVEGEHYATVSTSGMEVIAMPENPTPEEGYAFDGWYWDSGVWEKPFTVNSFLNEPLTSDMAVYAKFKPVEYTITYHTDGGAHTNAATYTVEGAVTLTDATKEGYVFRGWYADAALTTEVTEIAVGTKGNMELYARWESLVAVAADELTFYLQPDDTYAVDIGNMGAFSEIEIPAVYNERAVVAILEHGFADCTNLKKITIPASIKHIGAGAFKGCTALEGMTVHAENTVYHSAGNCLIETASKTLLFGCKSSVLPTDGSVERIAAGAFNGASGLSEITLPASVTSIGADAFLNCTGLEEVYIVDLSAWLALSFENDCANPLVYGASLYYGDTVYSMAALSGAVVYQNGLDAIDGSDDYSSNGAASAGVDYPVDAALSIKEALVGVTGSVKSDAEAVAAGDILVGIINCEESRSVLSTLKANEWAVRVVNGKVVIAAWNDTALKLAVDSFLTKLQVIDNHAALHEYKISGEGSISGFVTDFEKPVGDGISLVGTQDVGDGSMLYVWQGSGVSATAFTAYCAQLEAAGYTLLGTETVTEGSYFRTYLNNTKGVTLNVSYQAHTHAAAQSVDAYAPSLRVVSASTDAVTVDEELFVSDQAWLKRTDTMITQLKMNYAYGAFGNSYVITLEDGSFVVIDGGMDDRNGTFTDTQRLWNVLNDLYTKVFGTEPTENAPIHIRAWILTHEHSDHFTVFKNFCQIYGESAAVRIDRLISSFTSAEERYNTHNPQQVIQDNLAILQGYVTGGFDYVRVHAGQKLYLCNLEINVLYTHEDLYPKRPEYFNNTSTVFRFVFHSSYNNSSPQSFLMLGDAERVVSRWLRSMYGAALQSDMVQVAHHGYNGCEQELYALVAPKVVFCPTGRSQWKSLTRSNTSPWYREVDYFIAYQLESVKMILVADTYNTTLILGQNGPDYENLYDAYDQAEIVYHESGDYSVIYRPD